MPTGDSNSTSHLLRQRKSATYLSAAPRCCICASNAKLLFPHGEEAGIDSPRLNSASPQTPSNILKPMIKSNPSDDVEGRGEADPLGTTMHGILGHPAAAETMRQYLDNVLAWRRDMGRFNRVATSAGLYVIGFVLFLHFANRSGRPEQGATFSRLLAICEARRTCGPRALRTILTLAHIMGYLGVSRARGDRRVQIYAPTDKLLTQTRQQYALVCGCLDRLVPSGNFASTLKSDPAFMPSVFASSGQAFLDLGLEITGHVPDLEALIQMQAGFPTFASIVNAHLRGIECPSAQAIAKEFHVSSSQVRTVLKAAADRGLITLSERGQVLDAAPLAAQHKAMIARELALYAKYAFGLEDYFAGFCEAPAPQAGKMANHQLQSMPG